MEMASDAGWLEVEQTLTAMELPPVPPTSDPQRLLSYVVNILPKYTEMEMLSTHLRLYVSTLEQEMEQVRGHVRVLSREVESESEKKQFLERYAAQIVKERNELLHAKGTKHSKKNGATATSSGHFAWHACCKKNATHAMDMTPSITAFRGEKLQDAMHQIKNLQDEIRNQEMLRREMDFLLKKTQREHDSKLVADRKNIQQLERQLLQRSMLFSNLERKLYEVETSLAKHDQVKEEQMDAIKSKLQADTERIEHLEKDNETLSDRVQELVAECDYLSKKLSVATEAKNSLAERLDKLNELQEAAEAEIDSLRSEIELLQSTDIKTMRSEYTARIQKLQRENDTREQNLHLEIDRLRQELQKNKSEKVLLRDPQQLSLLQMPRAALPAGLRDGVMDISLPVDAEWRESLNDGSISLEHHEGEDAEEYGVGSSLSRSQLSDSSSVLRSESSQSVVARKLFHASQSQRSDNERHTRQATLVATGEREEGDRHGDDGDDADEASNASSSSFFNWESFIDSPSECSTPDAKRTKRMSQLHEDHAHYHGTSSMIERELQEANAELQRLELSSPVSPATEADTNDEVAYEQSLFVSKLRTSHHHRNAPASDADSAIYDDIPDLEYSEEEKDEEKEQSGDLAQELRDMLDGFERKRIEEERKAALAEQALQQFQKTQQGDGFE